MTASVALWVARPVPAAGHGTPGAPLGNEQVNTALGAYYGTVAPFYEAEMACRNDVPDWVALAERSGARRIVDLGCGSGRVARALQISHAVIGVDIQMALLSLIWVTPDFRLVQADLRALPFADAVFDLAIAANDPFAHLLDDADRVRALDEAARVATHTVIDGLHLTDDDRARSEDGGLVREQSLAEDVHRSERWTALGDDRYRTTYRYVRAGETLAEATTDVRAWRAGEAALQRDGVQLHGALDARPYEPKRSGFVIAIGELLSAR